MTPLDQVNLEQPLPGEPAPRVWRRGALIWEILRRIAALAMVTVLALPLWPVYLAARIFLQRPPNVPSLRRLIRCLRLIATERPEGQAPTAATRFGLSLSLLTRWAAAPIWGLAWFLDEILYGRALRRVAVLAPLFEISAARSGSTQLAHYVEDDPQICAPSLLQTVFPYLWLWKLAPSTLGRLVTKEQVRARVFAAVPPAYLQRHEMDPFRTDTFEIQYLFAVQSMDLLLCLGPRVLIEEFSPGRVRPPNKALWEEDFLRFIDGLARKTLLHANGRGGAGA